MYKAVRKCKAHAEPAGGDVTPVRKARLAYKKCGVVVIIVEIDVISGYDGDSGLIRKKNVGKREISFMKESNWLISLSLPRFCRRYRVTETKCGAKQEGRPKKTKNKPFKTQFKKINKSILHDLNVICGRKKTMHRASLSAARCPHVFSSHNRDGRHADSWDLTPLGVKGQPSSLLLLPQ